MYMIETPHEKGECLKTLDAQMNTGPRIGNKFYYGCKDGDHTGYALVDLKDKKEGISQIPDFLRARTKIVEVEALTPDEAQRSPD